MNYNKPILTNFNEFCGCMRFCFVNNKKIYYLFSMMLTCPQIFSLILMMKMISQFVEDKKFNYKCDNWNRFLYNGFLCVYRFNIWSLKGVKAFMQITSNWLIFTEVGNLVFVVLFARIFFYFFVTLNTNTLTRQTHTYKYMIWFS